MVEPVISHYGPRAYDDHPPFLYADYRSTVKRSPTKDLIQIVQTLSETTGPGPVLAELHDDDADMTTNSGTGGQAIGSRSIITGRVLDENGNGVPNTLIELWQCNASGRYVHWREVDYPAPLDPNFLGVGQCKTNTVGEYRFVTVKPGAYPWGNHPNAWRPAHIHFSLWGPSLNTRLVTQMYFPDDPLFEFDPIYRSAPEHSRTRMIASYDHTVTQENWALGYRWDIILRGELATPVEEDH